MWERNHSGQQSGYGASKSDTCFLLFHTRTDENLISRPGTNGYVSKLPAICPYGRPKASLLPKIFCLRKHVSSFADCFTGMVSFFVVYWLLPYSCGETEHGKEENFSESDICGMLEQPVGWILSPELLQASKMTVFHRTVGREVYLPFQLLWKKGMQFVLCHAKPD